jgi:hypothetical protein
MEGESPEKCPRTEAEEENGPQGEELLQAETEEEMQPQANEEALQAEAEKRERSRWEALLLEAEVIAANLKESGTRR